MRIITKLASWSWEESTGCKGLGRLWAGPLGKPVWTCVGRCTGDLGTSCEVKNCENVAMANVAFALHGALF